MFSTQNKSWIYPFLSISTITAAITCRTPESPCHLPSLLQSTQQQSFSGSSWHSEKDPNSPVVHHGVLAYRANLISYPPFPHSLHTSHVLFPGFLKHAKRFSTHKPQQQRLPVFDNLPPFLHLIQVSHLLTCHLPRSLCWPLSLKALTPVTLSS